MAVPLLRPGQTHAEVPRMKAALIKALLALDLRPVAALIRASSKTHGPASVKGVRKFQEKKGLEVDGIVGRDTWRALGIDEPVEDVRRVLHGVPGPDPGVVALDGRWVDAELARELVAQRSAGRWRGAVFSGYRPPWYQKRLFDQAVIKYGSVEAARKWVAPPGKSRHGMTGGKGAVDVTPESSGADLERASTRLLRPMSWEPWHIQMSEDGTRDFGLGEEAEEEQDPDQPPPTEALAEVGVALEDVDDTIAIELDNLPPEGEEPPEEYGSAGPREAD